MRKRALGKSGMEVGEIGLGTWGLSGESYGPVVPAVARATIAAALDEGASFIDTASCYGEDGAVERMVGEVVRARGRDTAFVCTRIGVDRSPGTGVVRKRFEPATVDSMARASVERLGLEYADAILLHNPLPSTLARADVTDALLNLRHTGRARFVGVSVGSLEAARAALRLDIDLISLPYNLLHSKLLHGIAAEIARTRVGVVAHSVLSYGLLAGTWAADRKFGDDDHRGERWNPAQLARRVRQREAARYLVEGDIKTLWEAAIRYVLSNGLVSVALVGARTPDQARGAMHAADVLPYLPDAAMGTIGERMREEGVD